MDKRVGRGSKNPIFLRTPYLEAPHYQFPHDCHAHRFAIKKGYRHIDCAKIYLNEKAVGEVFADIIGKEVPRKELFIVGKVG